MKGNQISGWLFVLLSAMILVLSGSLSGWAASSGSLETVTLSVPGMHCRLCPLTVQKALRRLPGVVDAQADLKTKTATVTIQPNRVSVGSLEQATREAGYPSSVLSLAKASP